MKLERRVASALPWAVLEGVFNVLSGVLSTLIIGRLLEPVEVGRVGVALAVVALVEIVVALGIGDALIRSRSAHTSLSDSAFTGLLMLSGAGMVLCLALAPPLAGIYGDPEIGHLLMAGSLLLPLSAVNIVPVALLTRKMRIGVLTRRGMVSKLVTLVTALGLAWAGFGAWSILASALAGSAVSGLVLYAGVARYPRLRIERQELLGLMSFGSLVSLEAVLLNATARVFSLVFGLSHGVVALGYLGFAQRLVDEVANLVQNFASRFGLSYFSAVRRAGAGPAAAFLTGTRMIAFVAVPLLAGLAVVAPEVVVGVIGAKWEPALPIIAVMAVSWVMVFPTSLAGPVLRADGTQRPLILYSVLTCAIALLSLPLTQEAGFVAAAAGWAARNLPAIPFGLWMARRHLRIPAGRFLSSFAGPVVGAAVMAAAVLALKAALPPERVLLGLGLEVAAGAVAYLAAVFLVDRRSFAILRDFAVTWRAGRR